MVGSGKSATPHRHFCSWVTLCCRDLGFILTSILSLQVRATRDYRVLEIRNNENISNAILVRLCFPFDVIFHSV